MQELQMQKLNKLEVCLYLRVKKSCNKKVYEICLLFFTLWVSWFRVKH